MNTTKLFFLNSFSYLESLLLLLKSSELRLKFENKNKIRQTIFLLVFLFSTQIISAQCLGPANDCDGDGIVNSIDQDDDNDGILDTDECGSTNRIANGVFPTTGGNTNTVPGWTVGGTFSSVWPSTTGRVNLNGNGLEFRRDEGTTTTLSQNLTGVTSGSVLSLNQMYWFRTVGVETDNSFTLTISYAGVTYATITSTDATTPSIQTFNGASVNISSLSAVAAQGNTSSKVDVIIRLPYTVLPSSGTLLFNFAAGVSPTQVRDLGMRSVSLIACKDTDTDGVPDYLDLDSDNDGCSDAIEGDGNITNSQVSGGQITGGVDANGVPTTAAGGQAVGESTDASKNNCIDTDGDGVPDWKDVDNDNDGILDTVELYCDQTSTNGPNGSYPVSDGTAGTGSELYKKQLLFFDWSGVTLSASSTSATKSVVYNGVTYTATITGYDNSGASASTAAAAKTLVGNDVFYGWTSAPISSIFRHYNVNGNTFKEILYTPDVNPTTGRLNGNVKFNIKFSATKGGVNYPVEAVVFDGESTASGEGLTFVTDGTNFTELEKFGTGTYSNTTINGLGTNTLNYYDIESAGKFGGLYTTTGITPTVNVTLKGNSTRQGVGFAIRLYCDTDNDGIFSYLDLDSDNDGCLDAIEGGADITSSQLVNSAGTVSVGTGSTASNQNLCASATCVDSNGIPQLSPLPTGYSNTTGQTIGTSQNPLVNTCFCYETPTNLTASVPVKHGITVLGRAGADNGNWPMLRNSAYTALEGKTKGFVVTRNSSPETTITNPVVGMMVFDTNEGATGCLKIYTGSAVGEGWKCFSTQGCP